MRINDKIQDTASRLAGSVKRLSKKVRRSSTRKRLKRIDAVYNSWHEHLPAFLNAVSTVGAFGHEMAKQRKELSNQSQELANQRAEMGQHGDSIRELWERMEFVRRELFYEMKFASGPRETATVPTEARILNPDKLEEAKRSGNLRVNIGCGHIPLDGYINVDMRDLPGVDVVADVGGLPFEPDSVQELFSAHVLEHFPEEQLRRGLLPHWRSVLAPGGKFRAIVPDGEAMLEQYAQGNYPFEEFREVLFGAQEYDGDFHFNLLTPDSLQKLLAEGGFSNIDVPAKGRRNGKCYEFEIEAERQSAFDTPTDDRDGRRDPPSIDSHLHG
ncbi:MAG: hypothetical protein JXQ99_16560 [Hyphomicrobiaceae bacterium]